MFKKEIHTHLGIENYQDCLLSRQNQYHDVLLDCYVEDARKIKADYIFLCKDLMTAQKTPFLYIYDYRNKERCDRDLSSINRQIWTLGVVSLAVVVYACEVVVLDTRKPINRNTRLPDILESYQTAKDQIRDQIRIEVFEGKLLEKKGNLSKDFSPYNILIEHIQKNILKENNSLNLRKLIVKLILVKFLECQEDELGYSALAALGVTQSVVEIIAKGEKPLRELFQKLKERFNGNIFDLEDDLTGIDWNALSHAFQGNMEASGQLTLWDLYDFKVIPIEFLSVLYETLIIAENTQSQKKDGSFYTPPCLAQLMVDEALPLTAAAIDNTDLKNLKLFDPSCGSGIFLVLAFKRLVIYWRVQNKKEQIKDNDIHSIQELLTTCIYGNDINRDALHITAISLQIELLSHLQPKQIIEKLHFQNLQDQNLLNFNANTQPDRLMEGIGHCDIVLGNPPFLGSASDVRQRKDITIPDNQSAFCFLEDSLNKWLKDQGKLLLILPAALIYGPRARRFKAKIFREHTVLKILDFTPLRDHLFKNATISTIVIYMQKSRPEITHGSFVQHTIVRDIARYKAEKRFAIDPYDVFQVLWAEAIDTPYIWKVNLMGGGYVKRFIDRIRYNYRELQDYLKDNNYTFAGGAKSSKKEGKALPYKMLQDREVIADMDSNYPLYEDSKPYRLDKQLELFTPPFICIKCNPSGKFPLVENYNDISFIYSNTFLGIRHSNIQHLRKLAEIIKKNRDIYIPYTHATSSKSFIQKSYSMADLVDLKTFPIALKEAQGPCTITLDEIDRICVEDINIMAASTQTIKNSPIYQKTNEEQLEEYCEVFCRYINKIFHSNNFYFNLARKIISENFIWVSFEHTDKASEPIREISEKDQEIIERVLAENIIENGFIQKFIITYYGENNRVSFIKRPELKYWMKSVALRDMENFKGYSIKTYGF